MESCAKGRGSLPLMAARPLSYEPQYVTCQALLPTGVPYSAEFKFYVYEDYKIFMDLRRLFIMFYGAKRKDLLVHKLLKENNDTIDRIIRKLEEAYETSIYPNFNALNRSGRRPGPYTREDYLVSLPVMVGLLAAWEAKSGIMKTGW